VLHGFVLCSGNLCMDEYIVHGGLSIITGGLAFLTSDINNFLMAASVKSKPVKRSTLIVWAKPVQATGLDSTAV